MCGILYAESPTTTEFAKSFMTLKNRGPDDHSIYPIVNCVMGHTRLAIHSPSQSKQPFTRGPWVLIFNGEIYMPGDGKMILDMVEKHGPLEAPKHLDGIFAYVLYNKKTLAVYATRDPIGVCPLFKGLYNGKLWIASEAKALQHCDEVKIVQPGHVNIHRYTRDYPRLSTKACDLNLLENLLVGAVRRRVPKVPWGVLLSGGLDSSIICGILSRINLPREYPAIHSFSIGLKDSPDLVHARKQAELCNTVHHEIIYTEKEGLDRLQDVIYAIESYDVTTVRASVPMFLLAEQIKKHGVKVVLSGEGSDELFGGYLYNRFCPSELELQNEIIRKMEDLHYYDCCRANKSTAVHGIECRVPFLDKTFVNYAMNLDPIEKESTNQIEKKILREAFKDYLHPDIYKRQKAQFSDAVGSKWIESLKRHAKDEPIKKYDFQTPVTHEAALYRRLFAEKFKHDTICKYHDDTVACSSASAHKWSSFECDPSAKSLYK